MVLHPASTIVALILRNIHHILFHLPANQPSVVITKKQIKLAGGSHYRIIFQKMPFVLLK